MSLSIRSWAFFLEEIPVEFTGDGKDVSPPLEWSTGPDGTRSYALVMDDPDGPRGSWAHWVAWNIPVTKLPPNVLKQPLVETAEGPMCQGKNSYNRYGYAGPCPPTGTHRYFFKVFALDCELDLCPETTRAELLAAIEEHVLDEGELMVTYSRARATSKWPMISSRASRPG